MMTTMFLATLDCRVPEKVETETSQARPTHCTGCFVLVVLQAPLELRRQRSKTTRLGLEVPSPF